MRVDLPASLRLTCPECETSFTVQLRSLADRRELTCPYCGEPLDLYNALPGKLRRKAYHAIRDALEQRIYYRYRQLHGGFDEWGGEAGDSADSPQQ
jgi:predicted Zn finger-like uncharacterized protein